jgi:hypothetical protein
MDIGLCFFNLVFEVILESFGLLFDLVVVLVGPLFIHKGLNWAENVVFRLVEVLFVDLLGEGIWFRFWVIFVFNRLWGLSFQTLIWLVVEDVVLRFVMLGVILSSHFGQFSGRLVERWLLWKGCQAIFAVSGLTGVAPTHQGRCVVFFDHWGFEGLGRGLGVVVSL